MGLWSCPEHGLTGPEACCRRASFAAAYPDGPFPGVQPLPPPAPPDPPCDVPGCYVCGGLLGRAPRAE